MAVINWNPVTVYPEGTPVRDLMVQPTLVLPSGWKYATAMPVKEQRGDTIVFGEVTLEELIDFPVLCGLYMKSYNIAVTPSASYFVHVAVDADDLLPRADSAFVNWQPLVQEAEALFGRTHFDEYHFLVAVADSISHYGLEHRNSSVNACGRTALTEYGRGDYFIPWVLPHEFVHSWCGKYRRPAGMSTPDYQQPKQMRQLWIYEGLTQYLGELLSVRSGLVSRDYYYGQLSVDWGRLKLQAGREWRSLSDIALSTQTVWHNSESWSFYRRRADYYDEGALLWLEVDCRIREASGGAKSLDNFCRSFFGAGDPDAHSVPYELADVVAELSKYADFNFDSLFTVRVGGHRESLDLTPAMAAGWSLDYGRSKPQALANSEKSRECRFYYESLGFAVTDDGLIQQIIPHSPADSAGLSTGMNILGVNGHVFSAERLETALDDCTLSGTVGLLVSHGDMLREMNVRYDGGLRYYVLKRRDGTPDRLQEITTPRARMTGLN
jgi:predicted metalloprotease with PDZ domain